MQTGTTYNAPGEPTNYADFGRRLVAAIIDGIIVSIPLWILMAVFGVSAGSMMAGSNMSDGETAAAAAGMMGTIGLVYLIFFVVVLGYYAYFESSEKQATLGKQAMGIKVVGVNGERISFPNALGRAAVKSLLSGICLIGYLMALFTAKKQSLHDLVASTLVVTK